MSRSYGHRIKSLRNEMYRISWVVDFYYRDSRLRHPREMHRVTEEPGARRFAKKHGLTFPPKENA